jgi:O-antigen ligase
MKLLCSYLIIALIAVCTIGVIGFSYDFSHTAIAHIYILDFLFLITLVIALFSNHRYFFESFGNIKTLFLFVVWGMIRFSLDLLALQNNHVELNSRTLQHTILIFYPLMWASVGYWLYLANPKYTMYLAYVALISVIIFTWTAYVNISVGPLAVLALIISLKYLFEDLSQKRTKYLFISIFLSIVSFFPFWKSWQISIQRTSFVELLLSILLIPWLVSKQKLVAIKSVGSMLLILVTGFVASNYLTTNNTMTQQFYITMQHGEDVPIPNSTQTFQLRARKLFWSKAFEMWKQNPLIGVGFTPEVPTLTTEEFDYVEGHGYLSRPPISGPHNSYLTIIARMGLIGLSLFLIAVLTWFLDFFKVANARTLSLAELLIYLIPIFGLLHASVNIGLEAPQNCFILWLFWGVSACQMKFLKKPSQV